MDHEWEWRRAESVLLSYGPEVFEMCLPQPLGTHYLDGKDGFRDEVAGGEGCFWILEEKGWMKSEVFMENPWSVHPERAG